MFPVLRKHGTGFSKMASVGQEDNLWGRFKLGFYTFLEKSGFYRFWRYFNRDNIVILMLHGVMDEAEPAQWVPTRPQVMQHQFDESLRLISKYYKIIPISEAVAMLSGERAFHPNCVVLTFDDGYKNNLTHAWPVLEKHGVSASVYPSVGFIDRREPFWFERLDYAIQAAAGKCEAFKLGEITVEIDAASRDKLRKSVKRAIVAAKAVPGTDQEARQVIDSAIEFLEKQSGTRLADIFENDPWSAVMTWDDLREACDVGFEVGSHTVDHARLALLDEAEIRRQLSDSKVRLEQELDRPVDLLCYPNGCYNAIVLNVAKECGYRAALTTKEGVNRKGDDLLQLKRFHLPQGR
ncbi:MAG TPA: hypothetical protein ENK06_09245, partial [Gammaproteobacteria bacterium]|nr:hypothetical protein [Gammaproteobacteria bacterium]